MVSALVRRCGDWLPQEVAAPAHRSKVIGFGQEAVHGPLALMCFRFVGCEERSSMRSMGPLGLKRASARRPQFGGPVEAPLGPGSSEAEGHCGARASLL